MNLSHINVLCDFNSQEITEFKNYLEPVKFKSSDKVLQEGENSREMFFLIEGEAYLKRALLNLGIVKAGDHFGELCLISGKPRSATVIAKTDILLAKLSLDNYHKLISENPYLSAKLMQSLVSSLGHHLIEMTESVELLLQQRTLPRSLEIEVTVDGLKKKIHTGTRARDILPEKVGDSPVVAALLDYKAVPLSEPVISDSCVSPLATIHWEGERIYRRSAALLLLEAARQIEPELDLRLGVSLGNSQWIEVNSEKKIDIHELTERLKEKMDEYIRENIPFRHEIWTVEEALNYFNKNNMPASAQLLQTWREPTVQLVSCGNLYVISLGTLASNAGILNLFELKANSRGLVLITKTKKSHSFISKDIFSKYAGVMFNHQLWLNSLGVRNVGDFNKACINGEVSDVIRIAEGFHEKNISKIADKISERPELKVIFVAGPSSSGKTTFIKRLKVQLQINGLSPIGISLDDYYLDREMTVKNEDGEYDFEALEALNLELLRQHISLLLKGETVITARYDFINGRNLSQGGKKYKMSDNNILILEGIHGLNPNLIGAAVEQKNIFRIFIQPMTALSFDRLSRVNPSDLRLIRRIVRDRHQRGAVAAENIMRWPSVRDGEQKHIFPYFSTADVIFDTSLIYELSVLKVYGERYLLEVPKDHPAYTTAFRLRQLIDKFVAIYPDHVPPTSILREFIGESGFEY